MKKWALGGLIVLVALFVLIQIVPYGRDHTNPPVTQEVKWDSARTRDLAVGACYDCHSNLTTWPWYSNVAPMSWLIQKDVDEGREILNFTEWNRPQESESDEIVEVVREGEMPPWQYEPLHPAGRLSSSEQGELALGLERTLAADPPAAGTSEPGSGREDGDDD
ncbi:MAG TPA: heme-binding domain-containing protein [Gaiellaceae bacterium]|nr:heme-binding domain-containing protein [Gaiellaceae bacterium]